MADNAGRITLWQIEVFLATAEESSVKAAAERLNASASAVSQQLTNLEQATGVTLIDRSARPLTLTPHGESFRRRAHIIRHEAEQARIELARLDHADLTLLRLGMIEDFDAVATPALLREMADKMTSARFLLETGPSHRLVDQLDARALDVVVAADFGAAADWMEVHPILTEPFVAVVPKGSDVTEDVAAHRLPDMPLIQYTSRHQMGRQLEDHLARQNLTIAHRFELDSYHAILAMVAAGSGWTILTPLGVAHAARFADQIRVLPLPIAPLSRTISLTARRGMLADVPGEIAGNLRRILDDKVITPTLSRQSWLRKDFHLL